MKLYVIFQLAKRSSIPKALIAEGGPHRECDGGEPTGLVPPEGRGPILAPNQMGSFEFTSLSDNPH
jgi:hypothetical protein